MRATRAWASRRAVEIVVALAIAVAVWRAATFCAFVGLPSFYVKDLGNHYITTEYVRHSVRSLTDFRDMLGWSLWWDQPLFWLNGYESSLLTVPLSMLVGTWEAIKILEVLAIAAAGVGTYALARTAHRSRTTSAVAGLLYAAMPFVTFAPRGNLDFAISVTLLPGALALGLAIVRRFGARALPSVGLVASLVGVVASIEFALFVTLPTYLVVAAYAFDKRRPFAWASFFVVGGLVAMLLPAYYLVPTFFGSVFSTMAPRAATLIDASFSQEFSQGLVELVALVPRESLLSPVRAYNASSLLPLATIGGTIVWTFALVGFANGRASLRTRTGASIAAVCGVLTLASTCGAVPLGQAFWHAVGHVPVLNEIRTPDRFLTFVMPFVACAAADGVTALFALRQRVATVTMLALAFGTLFVFSASEHVWENQQDYGSVEPDLAAVGRVVATTGARTISFAVANGGSPLDVASYGVPTPIVSNAFELASRYASDGFLGMGVLQRAGVASIVTSPHWDDVESLEYPDYDGLLTDLPFAPLVYRSPGGLHVRALRDVAPAVSGVVIGCVWGGPGLLDRASTSERVRGIALESGRCRPAILTNPDWATLVPILATVPGTTVCPRCVRLSDVDETSDLQRYDVKNAWYRDSIDGDEPTFGRPFAALVTGRAVFRVAAGAPIAKHADLLIVRGAAHAYVELTIVFADGTQRALRLLPGRGLRSVAVPIPAAARGAAIDVYANVGGRDFDDFGFSWLGYGLDGFAFARARDVERARRVDPHAVLVASQPLHDGDAVDAAYAARRLSAAAGDGERPWVGDTGRYVFEIPDGDARDGDVLRARGRPAPCCDASFATGDGERIGLIDLARGEPVGFARASRARVAWLTRVADRMPLVAAATGEETATVDFAETARALSLVRTSRVTPTVQGRGFSGSRGSELHFSFAPRGVANVVVELRGVRGLGRATLSLACGKHRDRADVSPFGDDRAVVFDAPPPCRGVVRWRGRLAIERMTVKAYEARTHLAVWIPAGRYRISFESDRGRAIARSRVALDGRALRSDAIVEDRARRHDLAFASATSLDYVTLSSAGRAVVPAVDARATAAIRYHVVMHGGGALKVTHLDDGNWTLRGASGSFAGTTCDLIDTCFAHVPAGSYDLSHRYDVSLRIGLLLSALALVLAASPLVPLARFAKRAA